MRKISAGRAAGPLADRFQEVQGVTPKQFRAGPRR